MVFTPLNIWFNESTTLINGIVKTLKTAFNNSTAHIHVSSSVSHSTNLQVADSAHIEPAFENSEEYIKWCLDFCKKHNINIFIPSLNNIHIGRAEKSFEKIGTKLITSSPDAIHLFNNLELMYYSLEHSGFPVLPWFVCRGSYDLVDKVNVLYSKFGEDKKLAIRPTDMKAPTTRRFLKSLPLDINHALMVNEGTIDVLSDALLQAEKLQLPVPDLMVTPESDTSNTIVQMVSNLDGEPIYTLVSTETPSCHYEFTEQYTVAEELAKQISRHYGLRYFTTVYFQMWEDNVVITDVTPTFHDHLAATLFTGINMMETAVNISLGEPYNLKVPVLGKQYDVVSNLVEIKSF